MFILGKTEVTTATVQGPRMGDGGTTTLVTFLVPFGLNGSQYFNVAPTASQPRPSFEIAKLTVYGLIDNSGDAYLLGKGTDGTGTASADGIALAPRESFVLGSGEYNEYDMSTLNVNAGANTDGLFWIMEVR